jgi:hypothetical protein
LRQNRGNAKVEINRPLLVSRNIFHALTKITQINVGDRSCNLLGQLGLSLRIATNSLA